MYVICKNNNKFVIPDKDVHYFDTLHDQMQCCSCKSVEYPHLEFHHVEMVYLLVYKPYTFIQPHLLPHVLMTADFLQCNCVVKICIQEMRRIITSTSSPEGLRDIFHEKHNWSPDEYENIIQNDTWCTQFKHSKIKI